MPYVRICFCELHGDLGGFTSKQEYATIGRIGQRAAKNKFSPSLCLPSMQEMFVSERGSAFKVVRHKVIEH